MDEQSELYSERFKVDRHSLEQLLKVKGIRGAQQFFDSVMSSTQTHVCWPSKLKVETKRLKSPYIKIVGEPEQVLKAKTCILKVLDDRPSRVILKIAMSNREHTFIIGRRGQNIQRIMTETNTHIHFPNYDRNLERTEKSNIVSVCGYLEQVEHAREMLRLLSPLMLSFQLPKDESPPPISHLQLIQRLHKVHIIHTGKDRNLLIKGAEQRANEVRQAAHLLMSYRSEPIRVKLQMEINWKYMMLVQGSGNEHLVSVMEVTSTEICVSEQGQVLISGNIDSVYMARQLLLGFMPVSLKIECSHLIEEVDIVDLAKKYNVRMSLIRTKRQRQFLIIRGTEKFVGNMYGAQAELMHHFAPAVIAKIPEHYFLPGEREEQNSLMKQFSYFGFGQDNISESLCSTLPISSTTTSGEKKAETGSDDCFPDSINDAIPDSNEAIALDTGAKTESINECFSSKECASDTDSDSELIKNMNQARVNVLNLISQTSESGLSQESERESASIKDKNSNFMKVSGWSCDSDSSDSIDWALPDFNGATGLENENQSSGTKRETSSIQDKRFKDCDWTWRSRSNSTKQALSISLPQSSSAWLDMNLDCPNYSNNNLEQGMYSPIDLDWSKEMQAVQTKNMAQLLAKDSPWSFHYSGGTVPSEEPRSS